MAGNKIVVIGGAGAMGRITVRDLVETSPTVDEIVVADFDFEKAQLLADTFAHRSNGPRVSALQVDVKKEEETGAALRGAFAVVNCVQYQFNLSVMRAALFAKVHYIDLGGLFHMTRKQLELHTQFKEIRRTAILGMGAAPGITNILSRYGADQLDSVTEIHTRVASIDQTRYVPEPALAVSYSLQTILEEFSFNPCVFRKGQFEFVDPMTGDSPHRFPLPIGLKRPMYTIHSEVATLPLSFAEKGVKEVSFKIAFDDEFIKKVRFLRDLGLGSHDSIQIQGVSVRPIDVINKIAMNQAPVKQIGKLKQYEVVRAIVKGLSRGKKQTWIVDCLTAGMPKWGFGTDIDTGSPPAIAVQMLAKGEITQTGAVPPEIAVPPGLFFKHLKQRNMTIKKVLKSGWGLKQ